MTSHKLWMDLTTTLHGRLRRLALLGAALAALVVSDWFLRHGELADQQANFNHALSAPDTQRRLDAAISRILADPNRQDCIRAQLPAYSVFRLRCLEGSIDQPLGGERKLVDKTRKVWDLELPTVVYRLLVLAGPLVLLAATLLTLRQLRRLHHLLHPRARDIAVQQLLNSPYFTRVTTRYGERSWGQALVAGGVNMIHVLNVVIYIPAVLLMENVVRRLSFGSPQLSVYAQGRPDVDALAIYWITALVVAVVMWGYIVFGFQRLWSARRGTD